jgi:hypothetical protein
MALADSPSVARITARLLLDEPLEEAGRERDPACLDWLQVIGDSRCTWSGSRRA